MTNEGHVLKKQLPALFFWKPGTASADKLHKRDCQQLLFKIFYGSGCEQVASPGK